MLMVIFGAGASYDSYASRRPIPGQVQEPDRPPLANQLFDDRERFRDLLRSFPECRPLVPRLRHLKKEQSIEDELEARSEEGIRDPERRRQLAAVLFYIHTVVRDCDIRWTSVHHGITNYLALLDLIRHLGNDDVSLVTFNYDAMLDHAAEIVAGREIESMDDYLSVGPFKIFKLHGSVDWGQLVLNPPVVRTPGINTILRAFIQDAGSFELGDYFRVRALEVPMVRDPDSGAPLLPAIAIPVRSKVAFACPLSHLSMLTERLHVTDRVLIVGWRGMDKHFVDLLRDGLPAEARIEIVSEKLSAAQEVADRLKAAGMSATIEPLKYTFTGYVLSNWGRTLLSPGVA